MTWHDFISEACNLVALSGVCDEANKSWPHVSLDHGPMLLKLNLFHRARLNPKQFLPKPESLREEKPRLESLTC